MNIPQLRFPEFTEVWDNDTLDNLTERIGDGLHGTPEYVNNSEIYFINGNNLIDGRIQINETTKKVSVETFQQNDKNLNAKTLLISINGTIGSIARYNNEKVMLGKSVGYFNFKANPDFFYYLLNTSNVQNYFISELTGSTIKNLSLKTLREAKVNFPKGPEQIKISDFFKSIDEKIQALKKKHSLLEQYIKGVMQKLFSQELRFKDENRNDFPDWEEKMLGEVLIKNSTKNKNQKYSLVQSVSNKHGFINQDEMFEDRRVASKDTSNYYVIEKGHFAYNPSRIDVGSLAYKYDDIISVISPLYISFKANHKYVSDAYLLNWFSSEQFIKQMNGSFEGSVRNTLSYESLIKMSISLPKEKEQNKIASFLIEIDNRIRISENEILKLETWKKGLLQKMFC